MEREVRVFAEWELNPKLRMEEEEEEEEEEENVILGFSIESILKVHLGKSAALL